MAPTSEQNFVGPAGDHQLRQASGESSAAAAHIADPKPRDGPVARAPAHASGQNLDSGYAWLILLVMFLLQSSISGASRVYGIVYAKEVAIGYYDREQASWPIATASAVENFAGILAPALVGALSWRKIELLSTSLFILANLLAYFSNSLALDILALGLIQGLALSTCTVLTLVINNDYFERYRTTAYGIQMSGSTFGVLYLGPLVAWLLHTYQDFRLVYLALALVFCGNIFLVLFIRPRAETISREVGAELGAGATLEGARKNGGDDDDDDDDDENRRRRRRRSEKRSSREPLDEGEGRAQLARTRSLFEAHFERKHSIASISHRARSRRQSILARTQRASLTSRPAQGPPLGVDENAMIIKSKSGLELASGVAASEPRRQGARRLTQMRSSPAIALPDHHQSRCGWPAHDQPDQLCGQRNAANSSRRAAPAAKSSVTNSLCGGDGGGGGGLSNNQRVDTRDRGAPTLDELNFCAGGCDDQDGNKKPPTGADLERADLCSPLEGQHNDEQQQQAQYLRNCLQTVAGSLDKRELLMAGGGGARETPTHEKLPDRERHRRAGFSAARALALLRLPYLHCTWIMLALYYLIARVFVIILVDFADDHGFTLAESTELLNYWSLGELLGRLLLGSLIDLQYMSCRNCVALTCSLLAGAILCMVLVESYLVYAACSISIAALVSLEYMLINVLMVEYLGKEHVTHCYSLAACLSSLILFARPSLIGLFRDRLGSYDGLLILLAALALIFALLFHVLEPLLVRRWPKRQVEPSK